MKDRFMAHIRAIPAGLRAALALVLAAGLFTNMAVRATALRSAVPAQEARLQEMRRNAQEVLQLRSRGASSRTLDPTSLGELERSAEASGLKTQVASMTQNGAEGIAISFEGASFNRLVGWLDDLRLNRGIRVRRATFEDAGSNGTVSARLELQ